MLKKTITYNDYNGVERTEDFYFNLTKAEIMEMEYGTAGGLTDRLKRIVAAKEQTEIIKEFKELILLSYGEKSPDGKYLMKEDPVTGAKLSNKFKYSEAFSILYMELATDDNVAADFVNKIIPADIATELAKQQMDQAQDALPSISLA